MMNNEARLKDFEKRTRPFVCFVGEIWMPSFWSFVRTNPLPVSFSPSPYFQPLPTYITHPSLLVHLFSSKCGPVGVANDKCLPQVSGKQRRHDKCIAFHYSSVRLDEKQPVSPESAKPRLRLKSGSKLSSTVKLELMDTILPISSVI